MTTMYAREVALRDRASDADVTVQDIPLIRAQTPPAWPLSQHVARQRQRRAFWGDPDAREGVLGQLATIAAGTLSAVVLVGVIVLGLAINRVAPAPQAHSAPVKTPTTLQQPKTAHKQPVTQPPPQYIQPQPPARQNPPPTGIINPWNPGPPIVIGGTIGHGGKHHHR